MENASEFGQVSVAGITLPRMPLPDLCTLLAKIKERRDAAVGRALRIACEERVRNVRQKPLPPGATAGDAAAAAEQAEREIAAIYAWGARMQAAEEMIDPDLAAAEQYCWTPAGTCEVLTWALQRAGKTWDDLAAADKVTLRRAAHEILHLSVPDPTPAAAVPQP